MTQDMFLSRGEENVPSERYIILDVSYTTRIYIIFL